MFADLMTLAHFSLSLLISAAYSSGEDCIGSTPTLANIVDEILELFHSTCYKLKFLG